MVLTFVVLLPFAAACLAPLLARSGRTTVLWVVLLASALGLGGLLLQLQDIARDGLIVERHAWVPEIGLNVTFFVDSLGLFMGTLILGIGMLVAIYSRFYMSEQDSFGRFMGLLALFQGSMLGIVIADNVLLLVFFWELTSLSSFLLIGYWSGRADSRRGARDALIVTGLGGLALIGGMLLLGQAAGSFELTTILGKADLVKASPLYVPILLLVVLGCCTKSAQLPFQFWLPGAMAAPTPVSAYLHSATMVKAGLFLLARLWPILAGSEPFFLIVSLVGLLTMVVGAWIAIFKTDLKAILAYSTVSHLGMIAMLLGLGTKLAAVAAIFHLLNHALFKAALFLCAGIVEHETGVRDMRRLGGLRHVMPITATLATLAALAMAGVPLLNGFLSKEMMLEAAWHTRYLSWPWLFPVLATLGSAFSVLYALRFIIGVFFGKMPELAEATPHDPPLGLWLPVACLILPVILIGIAPGAVAQGLIQQVATAIIGEPPPAFMLALWHGWTPAFQMTLVAMALGVLALPFAHWLDRLHDRLPAVRTAEAFDHLLERLSFATRRMLAASHNGSSTRYVFLAILVFLGGGAAAFLTGNHAAGTRPLLQLMPIGVVGWVLVVAASILVVFIHQNRLLALVATSLAGLMVGLAFLLFSAPDLALTQLSVEVVTVILLLLALNYLPKSTPRQRQPLRQLRDAAVAIAAGAGIGGLLYSLLRRDLNGISSYYTAMAEPAGGGSNIVNVILVDFRGYDTMGEITVLAIAALTIYALLQSALRGAAAKRLIDWPTRAQAGDSHPLLLVVITRLLLPMALLVGFYIFLRGHQAPGGGFIAGLIVGIALVLQYMASGYAWASRRLPVDYHGLIVLGVLIAILTGLVALLAGEPFLTSTFGHFHIPLLGDIELASAMAFDLGVFLTVIGVVLLILAGLSRIASLAEPAGNTAPITVALEKGEDQARYRAESVPHPPIFGTPFHESAKSTRNEQD